MPPTNQRCSIGHQSCRSRARSRLFLALAVAVIDPAVLPPNWGATSRLLVGWDLGVIFYIVTVTCLFARTGIAYLRDRAAQEDEVRFGILVLTAAASLASLGALLFPKETEPDFCDFLYFSFVIGMTSQVSDVAVASRPGRRVVLVQGIVSFLFNVTLLALLVKIAASVI
jgi:uncharacterized membrane protein